MFDPKPVQLESEKIVIEPLTLDDVPEFFEAGRDPNVWLHMPIYRCETIEIATETVKEALAATHDKLQVAFKIVDKESKALVGSTRFFNIDRPNKTLEIGHTFVTPKYQRSHVNTHAKYLLLKHAFEVLGANRVQLKTHEDNHKSRSAIARIGGQFEGIIRNERINPDGSVRSSACFSLIPDEWPDLKDRLESLL